MSIAKNIAASLLLLASSATIAQSDTSLREAERLGTALYQLDRAIQAAQAAGQERRAFRRDDSIKGWVAEQRRDGSHEITFVGSNRAGNIIGLYRAVVDRNGQMQGDIERLDRAPVSDMLAAQYTARQRAEAVEHTRCSNNNETLVLRDTLQGEPGWRAYRLPRAAFPDVYLLGGSHRSDLSIQGTTLHFAEPLAGGCAVLQDNPTAAALQFVEEHTSAPNELHVYISHLLEKPLYVTSQNKNWLIENGRIRPVSSVPE